MPEFQRHRHQSGSDSGRNQRQLTKVAPKCKPVNYKVQRRHENACSPAARLSPSGAATLRCYFTSTVAPTSTNFFLMASASSLLTPSLTGFGAPSTRSLASFSPRLVTSRTALMTLILLAPAAVRMTVNSVFSSTTGAAAAAPPPAAAAGAAAAAETPNFSSSNFTSCDASSSVKP